MEATQAKIEILGPEACWDLLRAGEVGRLGVAVERQPDIFPVNYVVDDETVVFRTSAGTKLAAAVLGGMVAFEADGYDPASRQAWSVVIKGHAAEVERLTDYMAALDLPLFPWVDTAAPRYVRITPFSVTGRRFVVVGRNPPAAAPTAGLVVPPPGDTADDHPGTQV